jgi:hypothetical protein
MPWDGARKRRLPLSLMLDDLTSLNPVGVAAALPSDDETGWLESYNGHILLPTSVIAVLSDGEVAAYKRSRVSDYRYPSLASCRTASAVFLLRNRFLFGGTFRSE